MDAPAAPLAAVVEPPKKQRKVVLSGLLGIRVKKEATSPAPVVARDELNEYLRRTRTCLTRTHEDILKWWCGREGRWPALAKMVKQYRRRQNPDSRTTQHRRTPSATKVVKLGKQKVV